jgi:hypothetical protein
VLRGKLAQRRLIQAEGHRQQHRVADRRVAKGGEVEAQNASDELLAPDARRLIAFRKQTRECALRRPRFATADALQIRPKRVVLSPDHPIETLDRRSDVGLPARRLPLPADRR